jgi:hypothetical protein
MLSINQQSSKLACYRDCLGWPQSSVLIQLHGRVYSLTTFTRPKLDAMPSACQSSFSCQTKQAGATSQVLQLPCDRQERWHSPKYVLSVNSSCEWDQNRGLYNECSTSGAKSYTIMFLAIFQLYFTVCVAELSAHR